MLSEKQIFPREMWYKHYIVAPLSSYSTGQIFYFQEENGIIAFEQDSILWFSEDIE